MNNYIFNLFCESKLVHKTPTGAASKPKSGAESHEATKPLTSKERRKKLAKQQKLIDEKQKTNDKFNENLDKYIKNKREFEFKKVPSFDAFVDEVVMNIAYTLDADVKLTPKLKKFFVVEVTQNVKHALKPHYNSLKKYAPLKVTINPGGVIDFANENDRRILSSNLQKESFYATKLAELKESVKELNTKRKKKRQAVTKKTKTKQQTLRTDVDSTPKDLGLIRPKSRYVQTIKDGYKINFLKGRRIDRKAEKQTQIKHLFDLSKLKGGNMYITMYVKGESPGGIPHNYWAYYHPSQGTFIREGSTERAKVFHNSEITNIKYHTSTPTQLKVTGPKTKPVLKKAPQISEKERAEKRTEKIRLRDEALAYDFYYHEIFDNARFKVPAALQDDSDFESNWARIDGALENALTSPPFVLTTSSARRKYIMKVIQGTGVGAGLDLNSRLYAEDFFNYKINGKDLYKGGYKKFIKDFDSIDKELIDKKVDIDNPKNKTEEALIAKWENLRTIAFGISRVFDSLTMLQVVKKRPESREQLYTRRYFLGMPTIDKEPAGTKYHSIESLLHKREKGPKGLNIGVNARILSSIQAKVKGFNNPEFEALLKDKGGLKLLFMTYGLSRLIQLGCLKKLDDKRFILTKIPNKGWARGLSKIQAFKPKLWDHSKDNFKKWEKVRASLDKSYKSRMFIKKIFTPTGSQIKNNTNWWQKLMHLNFKKKQNISMAYLGKASLNPKDFEKFMAQDRGYLTMMKETSRRVEGSSVYEPQPTEVLNKANKYLEYGLLSTLMNVTDKQLPKTIDTLVKEFGLKGLVTITKPVAKNKMKNLDAIYKAIELKGVDPNMLSEAHIKMIRVGFVLGRTVEASKNWAETMQGLMSGNPMYRKIQMQALKNGCPMYLLKEVEKRIALAIFALSEGKKSPHFKLVGAAASVNLGEWGGQKWNLNLVGAMDKTGKLIGALSIGAEIKLGKKVKFKWQVASTVGYTGGAAAVEWPISSEWDMFAGVAAGVDWKGGKATIGGSIGVKWNQRRAELMKRRETLKTRGVAEIDKNIENGKPEKAAELILKNPHFGAYMKALKTKLKLPSSVLIDIYLQAHDEWENQARLGVKIPAVLGFGAGAFVGIDVKTGAVTGVGVGAYITFKIPGTEVNYVIRHEHPKFSEFMQTRSAQEALAKKLKGIKNPRICNTYTVKASTGVLYFDSRLGRSHISKPRNATEAKEGLAIETAKQRANLSFKTSIAAIRREFKKVNMHVEVVQDPKNPKKQMLAITPLQIQGSNVEMLIDPELKSKGLVLDRANNRVLLAASAARSLFITRTTYRYPYRKKGAMDLSVISFKNSPTRHNSEIREDSPNYIYKFRGEKYTIVRGEARTGITNGNSITLEQYKKRKGSFEGLRDHKAELEAKKATVDTVNFHNALRYKKAPEVRGEKLKLKKFAKDWYKANAKRFDGQIGRIQTPAQEDAFKTSMFKKLKGTYGEFATNEDLGLKDINLNQQELNVLYALVINESFTNLTKNANNAKINHRLKLRNNLFRRHMLKYIKEYIKKNKKMWDVIHENDPTATPDSIANYLMLTLPQNAQQFKDFQKNAMAIKGGMKFASYTQKLRKYDIMPTAFGYGRKGFGDIFQMLNPKRLRIDAANPKERSAARLMFQMLSPLHAEDLESVSGKAKFLQSELALIICSLTNTKTGISALRKLFGPAKFKGLTTIYKALQNKDSNPAAFTAALKNNIESFDILNRLVVGIRVSQLTGSSKFVYNDKFIFNLDKTEVYSGAYLKCGNGTVAIDQSISLTVRGETKTGRWSSAEVMRRIVTRYTGKKKAASITVGAGHQATFEGKPPPPSRHDNPKVAPPTRHTTATPTTPATPAGGGSKPPEQTGSGTSY